MTLFFCGDVMTGRGVDQVLPHPSDPSLHEPYVGSAQEYVEMAEHTNGPIPKPVSFSYIWGEALEELDGVAPAARIINLETSITTSEDYERKGINYRMHPANTPCLSAAKIDCCVLANNHVLDWGRSGLSETIRTLQKAGIRTAGAGSDLEDAWRHAAIQTGPGSRALVFAAGTVDSGIEPDWAATKTTSGVARLRDLSDRTAAEMAERVTQQKGPGDIAVLSIHWGENWGYEIPPQHQDFAHKLIDSAAIDVVHGHSSHHPKGIEVYKGKPILYGCGDFLDDYEGIVGYEEFRSHLVLAYFVTLNAGSGVLQDLEMVPFEIKRFQLRRPSDQDAAWLKNMMAREGKPLGTAVNLVGNHLALTWQ
ncbi:MAG TPA: CapA family protein [Bryobacteraceae bacterium]|nr:CapA family protein [Bryobacteraceae bacterium]